jgi:DNA invertase Pin-like site-specific DNA recombinase
VRIGYARTSTIEQTAGFEAQITELEGAGCEKIFQEQVSSMAQRPKLEAALDYIRDGDTLVVCKLDRLARSTQNLLDITDRIRRKGAHLHILNLGMDTGTATGKLLLTVIGAIGQFEREIMLERQREGIAKANGKYRGESERRRRRRRRSSGFSVRGLGRQRSRSGLGSRGRASTGSSAQAPDKVHLLPVLESVERDLR